MAESRKLPLKVVPALETDFYHPEARGGPGKIFGEVTREFRQRLSAQVIEMRKQFAPSFREFPSVPAVARVRVREDAVAKSHRPTAIFTPQTCPIIGSEGLGDLLLRVTPDGLDRLAKKIELNTSHQAVANISTLQFFEAYEPNIEPLHENVAKVKLFHHHEAVFDIAVDRAFHELVRRFGIKEPKQLRYGRGLKIYRIEVQTPAVVEALGRYAGTQSVGPFPVYAPVRSTAVTVRTLVADDFPKPMADVEYPIVGVIDSGTSPRDPYLSPWRISREEFVAAAEQDTTHGSFVSGLLVHARKLNHDDAGFPLCSARIVDIVALARNGTTEDKLLSTLEQAVEQHPEVKVWNLSLGTDRCIADRTFSDLGIALDRLQDEHGVTFIVAAGNYRQPPFRGWPPDDLGEADRVCAPADSVRSVVVGSVAHRDHSSSRVKAGHPSPFSRRGPGPLYLPKPELSHVGGNCKATGHASQIGVLSLDGRGNIAEDIGTSYAAPLVSTLIANVSHRIQGEVHGY
jgi:serine protease AprX